MPVCPLRGSEIQRAYYAWVTTVDSTSLILRVSHSILSLTVLEDAIKNCGYKLSKSYSQNKNEVHEEINEEQNYYNSIYVRQQLNLWLDKIEDADATLYKDIKDKLLVCIIRNKVMVYERDPS